MNAVRSDWTIHRMMDVIQHNSVVGLPAPSNTMLGAGLCSKSFEWRSSPSDTVSYVEIHFQSGWLVGFCCFLSLQKKY